MSKDDRVDPTRVRDQPALRTSGGTIWLIVGGLLALVSLAILVPMQWLRANEVATIGVITVAVLYTVMIVVRFTVNKRRRRLGILATCMIAMAVIALGSVAAVTAVEWNTL